MEATLKLIQFGEVTEGTNKKGEPWRKGVVIFETEDEKYPKQIAIDFFNSRLEEVAKLRVGDTCNVKFDISSREYNGKFYTSLSAYGIEPLSESQPQAQQPQQQYQPKHQNPPRQANMFDAPYHPHTPEEGVEDLTF